MRESPGKCFVGVYLLVSGEWLGAMGHSVRI